MAEKLLIQELKRGREDSYRQLVEEYGNRLLRTCYLILGDREEAEDIVQETHNGSGALAQREKVFMKRPPNKLPMKA